MQRSVFPVLVCVCLVAGAQSAAAQVGEPWTDRGYFNLNIGFETASGELNGATTRSIYGEQGSLSVAQSIDSGSIFDFNVGARVWQNVSAGIGFHNGGTDTNASVTGSIPHPQIFNRPRALALSASELDRRERAVHLQVGYMLVLNDRINVHVFAGPSFFTVKQDIVDDVTLVETAPFNTVNANANVVERQESPVGFNIGADVAYTAYTRDRLKVGAGMFLRFAGASADIQVFDNTVESELGGLQIGFGVRTRF